MSFLIFFLIGRAEAIDPCFSTGSYLAKTTQSKCVDEFCTSLHFSADRSEIYSLGPSELADTSSRLSCEEAARILDHINERSNVTSAPSPTLHELYFAFAESVIHPTNSISYLFPIVDERKWTENMSMIYEKLRTANRSILHDFAGSESFLTFVQSYCELLFFFKSYFGFFR